MTEYNDANEVVETAPLPPVAPGAREYSAVAPPAGAGQPHVVSPAESFRHMSSAGKVAVSVAGVALVAMLAFGAGWTTRGVAFHVAGPRAFAMQQQVGPGGVGDLRGPGGPNGPGYQDQQGFGGGQSYGQDGGSGNGTPGSGNFQGCPNGVPGKGW